MNRCSWLSAIVRRIKPSRNVKVIGSSKAPLRLLVVANAMIPTVQLSLISPLRNMVASGRVQIAVVTDQDMFRLSASVFSRDAKGWLRKMFAKINPTHLIFCRYSGDYAEYIMGLASEYGVPSIYCIDDDLLSVPRELGRAKYEYHNDPARISAVRYLLTAVDVVYCSNERLKARLELSVPDGRYLSGKIFCAGEVVFPAERRACGVIGYMGFDHAHDFEVVLPALVSVMRSYPNIRFELFGKIPKPAILDEFSDRVQVLPPVAEYDAFLQALAERRWDIGICPLAETEFNRVKNINKWIEYTAVGTAVVASRGMIYDECCADGCGLLALSGEWEQALLELINGDDLRYEMVSHAQRRLQEEYTQDGLVKQLFDVFSEAERNHRLKLKPVAKGRSSL